jgi:hypothetical protein
MGIEEALSFSPFYKPVSLLLPCKVVRSILPEIDFCKTYVKKLHKKGGNLTTPSGYYTMKTI